MFCGNGTAPALGIVQYPGVMATDVCTHTEPPSRENVQTASVFAKVLLGAAAPSLKHASPSAQTNRVSARRWVIPPVRLDA
jgi:hypothetical protein